MTYLITTIILLVQVILSLGHWWLYKTIVRFLVITDPKSLLTLKIGLGLLSLCFMLASIITFRYYNWATRAFYTFSAGWLGFFFYFFLSVCLFWMIFGLAKFFSLVLDTKLLLIILLSLATAFSVYGIFNAANPKVTNLNIKLPNLPQVWKNKTAVWVSDTHFGQIWNNNFAFRLTEIISRQKPDVIFIGGDFYDGIAANHSQLAKYFSSLAVSDGIYFISGNHEEFTKGDKDNKFIIALSQAEIKVLDNQMVNLDGLQIIGVDYASTENAQSFKNILENLQIDKTKPSILLKHSPSSLDIAEAFGVNFQISGHTHGGQIFPFGLITKLIFHGYDLGLKSYGKMQIYTSSGAGTWGPPMRIGTTPEILKIKIE